MNVALAPTRAITRAVMPTEKTPMTRLSGRNAMPVWMAPYPSTRWRYSAPMKKAPNSPTAKSALIPFATERVRERKMRRGMSGWRTVASVTRNAAPSATAPAPNPIVRVDAHPQSLALTMVKTASVGAAMASTAPRMSIP